MTWERRTFLAGTATAAVVGPFGAMAKGTGMYGLIGKMTAQPGKRAELTAILLDGVAGMPGCLSYVVADDPAEADTIWITEVWTDQVSHVASLQMPLVRDAITRGRPLIAGMERIAETRPLGGTGLSAR